MRARNLFAATLCLGLIGCEEQPKTENITFTPSVPQSTNQVELVQPFTITSKGTFKAGYDGAVREIFILKDNTTGTEYLGVTDCTLIKKIKAKEEAKAEAIETAVDMAVEVVEAMAE